MEHQIRARLPRRSKYNPKQVAASEIVFHTATADYLPSAEAVIAGINKRAKKQPTHDLHPHKRRKPASRRKCRSLKKRQNLLDERPEQIDALPDTAPHR